jgi:RND family efflux transporter MFP subunit
VEITYPVATPYVEGINLTGTFISKQHSAVSSRVDGLVATMLVDAGSQVKKGDLLVQFDDVLAKHALAERQAELSEAQVDLDEAQRLVTEAERLRKQSHISESELSKRKATLALKAARVNAVTTAVSTAHETLKRHQLHAPFSGIISQKQTEVGEWVSRGDPIVELTRLDALWLDVNVPQERFADMSLETPVTITPDSHPTQSIPARIDIIVPVSDEQARSFLVRISIDKPVDLLPGASANAHFTLAHLDQPALRIPRDALLIHPDGHHSLFVINQNMKAERRRIEIQQMTPEGVFVLNGVHPDDKVVIRGNEVLEEGQSVHLVEQAP